MIGFLKWMVGLGLLVAVGIGAGIYFAFYGAHNGITYITPDIVPIDTSQPSAAPGTQTPTPINLPTAVILPVPFTSQAPLNDWANKQHTCEEANLVMVNLYLHGDHSGALIDPNTANAAINQVSAWKPTLDMTPNNLGQLAHQYLGWAYQILPLDRLNVKTQLALGRPVIVGVTTHGLGNPNYPGYRNHFEQPGWTVSHYITVVGYDQADTVILNDPGLTRGHGYHISFDQLVHAVDDLDQRFPELNAGLVFLVLAPAATQ